MSAFGKITHLRERVAEAASRRLARLVATARVPIALDRPAVSFTFDDIPESAALAGAALLERRGVRGTFYVCGALAGTRSELYQLADLDRIGMLARAGHEIGCHSARHLNARDISVHAYAEDVDRNAALLRPVVGELSTFAYPYGAIGLRTKMMLQATFSVCRGIHGDMAAGSYDRGRLDAAALEDRSIGERGIDDLLDETVRRRAWLTFYAHDVAERPTPFGVSPDLLAYALGGALARGCLVDTVANVVARNAAGRGGAVDAAA